MFRTKRSEEEDPVGLTSMVHRNHLETGPAPEIVPFPNRTRVKVSRPALALHLLQELIRHWRNPEVAVSRPCVYGVFSGPVGGFAPRDALCVGCLRCMTEYPDMVRVDWNPAHRLLGDSYFTPEMVDTVRYEARTGRIPVKGAGYRGPFGGEGWDGMWTDMSEIVRPTRDGIHGREFISTAVDLGPKPLFLTFGERGEPVGRMPPVLTLPTPVLFDAPPEALCDRLARILAEAARRAETLLVLPIRAFTEFSLEGPHLVPVVGPDERDALRALRAAPRMIELDGRDEALSRDVQTLFPDAIVCLRSGFPAREDLSRSLRSGIRVFHFLAGYHGVGRDGRFVLDLIREAHQFFVDAKCRDEVTLIGSGGIIAGEHVPKAIICGLDAVALDTPLLAALQAAFLDECAARAGSRFQLPKPLTVEWGVLRLMNLMASWHGQLLEVMGAMGLREVRRLRGEMGRALFQKDLEREAFSGIEGYGE
jgi:hypothetical protein